MHDYEDMSISVYEGRPEREREAYLLWSGEAKGNMNEVQRLTQIPIRTLFSWQKKFHWKAEKADEVREYTREAAEEGKLLLSRAVRAAASRLVTMLHDEEASHHDQRENMRLLFELVFENNPDQAQTLVDARSIHISASELDDPLQAASAALAANVGQASADAKRGKRRGFQ